MTFPMNKELDAALVAAEHNIPFALFAFPGSEDYRFMANPERTMKGDSYFIINRWNTKFCDSIKVYNEMDAETFLNSKPGFSTSTLNSPIQSDSTTREEYDEKICQLIEILKRRGGKTVFSRIISETDTHVDLGRLVNAQFKSFPDTFRFLYYTPETGLWLGTSPELLFDYNNHSHRFQTMSLAGTKVMDDSDWDNKNICEQNIVAQFISDVLTENGAIFSVERCKDVHFEPVHHICDMFTGFLRPELCSKVLDQLSPTPAVSGFPVETAIKEISMLENHSRECYGGYVGFVTPDELKCYVNLRSLKLNRTGYCIFAGGGITAESIPEDEWRETENKTMILRGNINDAIIK